MTLYIACLALWFVAPQLPAHGLLADLFPQFELLTLPSFFYGLMASAIYGWLVAAIFVFFYNLWGWIVQVAAGGAGPAGAEPSAR